MSFVKDFKKEEKNKKNSIADHDLKPSNCIFNQKDDLRDPQNAPLVYLPLRWDATISNQRRGAAKAPDEIFKASFEIDSYDSVIKDPFQTLVVNEKFDTDKSIKCNPYCWLHTDGSIKKLNKKASTAFDAWLATGKNKYLNKVRESWNEFAYEVFDEVSSCVTRGQIPAIVGGDHSCAIPAINKINRYKSKVDPDFSILHIDAHMDLRKNYQGFEFSHASAMRNHKEKNIVQVGVRDFSDEEKNIADKMNNIKTWDDFYLKKMKMKGDINGDWDTISNSISNDLKFKNVWISFDIDALNPYLCPNTGTPVPGGLDWDEAVHLLEVVAKNHKIIGFDLCEVAPHDRDEFLYSYQFANFKPDQWDANVGMRLLYKLSSLALASQGYLEWR